MMIYFNYRILLVLLLFGFTTVAQSEPVILEVILYHGQNDGIQDDLKNNQLLKKKLITIFGYQKYQELGKDSGKISVKQRQRLYPTSKFFMDFEAVRVQERVYSYSFFHENKLMLQGEYIPKPKVPFLIRGPQYANGDLILVIKNSIK